jgi:glycosyltransferase involved in cell wall biosynthesis
MKVALVHDYLNQLGGAERVLLALHEIFPEAPIYTSIYDRDRMSGAFRRMDIRTSYMQNWPNIMHAHRYYFSFYPRAFESFDLSQYDLIISSSSAYAKGIKKRKGAKHICYCHTPARFLWRYADYVRGENLPALLKLVLPFFLSGIKKWDLKNNEGVDHFIANSRVIRERIRSFYGRDSVIIYPPVDTQFYQPAGKAENYFLIVSRLLSYKRIEIAIEAFNRLGHPLKIVGEGPEGGRLKKLAKSNISFLGRVIEDNEVARLYAGCRALIFTGEEDLGLAPLEAAACGKPTIAYAAGGALETVIDGETGILFKEQKVASILEAVKRFESFSFDDKLLRGQARKYDKESFEQKIRSFLSENKIL